ncbi:MAG: hypothetical protein ACOZAO_01630 [Patescibacteria group bacterium]
MSKQTNFLPNAYKAEAIRLQFGAQNFSEGFGEVVATFTEALVLEDAETLRELGLSEDAVSLICSSQALTQNEFELQQAAADSERDYWGTWQAEETRYWAPRDYYETYWNQ